MHACSHDRQGGRGAGRYEPAREMGAEEAAVGDVTEEAAAAAAGEDEAAAEEWEGEEGCARDLVARRWATLSSMRFTLTSFTN